MRSKSRLIAALAAMVACVAMVGTGFASWVILDSQSATTTGNVTAEAVSEDGISLSVKPENGAEIIFGSPAKSTWEAQSNPWLVEDASEGQGKFSVDIEVTVQGKVGSLKVDFSHEGDGYTHAVTAGLIAENPTYSIGDPDPTGSITSKDDIAIDASSGQLTFGSGEKKNEFNFAQETKFHVVATFSWGTSFGGKNPYVYFNDGQKTASGSADGSSEVGGITQISEWGTKNSDIGTITTTSWGEVAKGVLGWMHDNLNASGAKFTFTFTASQTVMNAG